MDSRKKDEIRARYLRGSKRERSYEEKKQLDDARRARGSSRKRGPRPRHWQEDDDDAGFQKITRRRPTKLARAAAGGVTSGEADPRAFPGVVHGIARGRVRVSEGERMLDARLAPALAREQRTAIAVGDRVRLDHGRDEPRVVAVGPRRTVLSRPDPAGAHRERVLAANVEIAVVVLSVVAPRLRPRLLDRMLVALLRGGVEPVFCINKIDLLPPEDRVELDEVLAPHLAMGIPCHLVSTAEGFGTAALREQIRGRTVVVVGPSGVGKSSLLNVFDPRGHRAVNAPRAADGKGRHTTTASSLVRLDDGTCLIDTPGVRAFGLWQTSRADVDRAFPDVAVSASSCRFRDCTHGPEPGCAVRETIAAERLETWRRIVDSL